MDLKNKLAKLDSYEVDLEKSINGITYNYYLFAKNDHDDDSTNYPSKFKMNYCKIYDNNVLIRNFIPCYRKYDNKPGLYDTVNNEFYTNQGNGDDFVVGPDIE